MTSLPSADPLVPPSPTDLKALFSPAVSGDSDDEDMDDFEEENEFTRQRSFKDSVHGWSEFLCLLISATVLWSRRSDAF